MTEEACDDAAAALERLAKRLRTRDVAVTKFGFDNGPRFTLTIEVALTEVAMQPVPEAPEDPACPNPQCRAPLSQQHDAGGGDKVCIACNHNYTP